MLATWRELNKLNGKLKAERAFPPLWERITWALAVLTLSFSIHLAELTGLSFSYVLMTSGIVALLMTVRQLRRQSTVLRNGYIWRQVRLGLGIAGFVVLGCVALVVLTVILKANLAGTPGAEAVIFSVFLVGTVLITLSGVLWVLRTTVRDLRRQLPDDSATSNPSPTLPA